MPDDEHHARRSMSVKVTISWTASQELLSKRDAEQISSRSFAFKPLTEIFRLFEQLEMGGKSVGSIAPFAIMKRPFGAV
jgi:hypothetical protein